MVSCLLAPWMALVKPPSHYNYHPLPVSSAPAEVAAVAPVVHTAVASDAEVDTSYLSKIGTILTAANLASVVDVSYCYAKANAPPKKKDQLNIPTNN